MREVTIGFGENDGLVGTVTLPDGPGRGPAGAVGAGTGAGGVGLVLTNAGIVHRVGPHRINVRIARRLAEQGIPSIRFDLGGHGDSARLTGQHSFEAQAVLDVRAALDALGSVAGVERFAVFGLCSGAYHAYETALVDERIVGLLMFDAYRYPTWKTHVLHYLNGARQPHFARRVLGFTRRAVVALGHREGEDAALRANPELGRVNYIPTRSAFAAGLRSLLDRGVNIAMIYSGGEMRNYNYRKQFRDTFAPFGIGDRIPATFLPHVDHQASTLAHQAELMRLIVGWSASVAGTAGTAVAAASA